MLATQNQLLRQLESRLQTTPPPPDVVREIMFSEAEIEPIRKVLAPAMKASGVAPVAKVGEVAPAFLPLLVIPEELLSQIKQLRGARFAIDTKSGLVLIVSGADNRVVALV